MHVEKYPDSAVSNQQRHNNRLIINDKNSDIDIKKTQQFNYSLTPYIKDIPREQYFDRRAEIKKREYDYYKQRKSEVYCYNRADIKTMAGYVVTLPNEINNQIDEERFFKATVDFFSNRYGAENIISATVHKDESKLGSPHMHLDFMPICKIDHDKLMAKKNHCKAMENYQEKISANDVLTKRDLQTLHTDLQRYLDSNGIKGRVLVNPEGDGKTVNLSVAQLKEITKKTGIVIDKPMTIEQFSKMLVEQQNIKIVDHKLEQKIQQLEKENAQLQEQVKALEKQIEHQKEHTWGHTNEWGHNNGWGHTIDQEQEVTHTW